MLGLALQRLELTEITIPLVGKPAYGFVLSARTVLRIEPGSRRLFPCGVPSPLSGVETRATDKKRPCSAHFMVSYIIGLILLLVFCESLTTQRLLL